MRWSPGAMLAVVVLCGPTRADEAASVRMVEKLGGKVTRDDKQPDKPVIGVSLAGTTVTDAGLKELKELKGLKSLSLVGTRVTEEEVTGLQKALPDCRILFSLKRRTR